MIHPSFKIGVFNEFGARRFLVLPLAAMIAIAAAEVSIATPCLSDQGCGGVADAPSARVQVEGVYSGTSVWTNEAGSENYVMDFEILVRDGASVSGRLIIENPGLGDDEILEFSGQLVFGRFGKRIDLNASSTKRPFRLMAVAGSGSSTLLVEGYFRGRSEVHLTGIGTFTVSRPDGHPIDGPLNFFAVLNRN
jgi:hypothetical protein